jgi:poly-gamma-glutamate system protein
VTQPRAHELLINGRTRVRFLLAGLVSLIAWIALRAFAPGPAIPWTPAMLSAAERMAEATQAVASFCEAVGIEIDATGDPNGTCLVGPDMTDLFTTSGQLEAKRTTTNPDMAGLLTHLLEEAGVGAGDTVAVGASGSFPSLLLATVVATEALGATPVTILSLGASAHGATRPEFHLLDLFELLRREGYLRTPAAAVSLGGRGDVGGEFDPAFRDRLSTQLRASGIPFLFDPDLPSNVARRMEIYGSPVAFVNVGGAEANLGVSPRILDVPPGLAGELALPPEDQRGVLFQMAAAGVPVIHLLHVQGLTLRFGLAWDPIPLPSPGSTGLEDGRGGKGGLFWLLTALYFGILGVLAMTGRKSRPRTRAATGLKT